MTLFADIQINTETGVALGAVLAVMLGGIKILFNYYVAALTDQRDIYKKMSEQGSKALMDAANEKRAKDGKPPLVEIAPVVAEHASPVRKSQIETAHMATIRATMTAAILELGLPPRPPGIPSGK